MRSVITGAQGQDGYYLSQILRSRGDQVFGLRADVRDRRLIDHIVAKQPDVIYHLAGLIHGSLADLMETNAGGTMLMLEAAEKAGALLIHASTGEIFGAAVGPQNEQTRIAPRSDYAISKAAAHHMCAAREYACNAILFNHESPRRSPAYVTQKVCQAVVQIAKGERDHVALGSLDDRRDWGHAADHMRGMADMVYRPDDYVFATGITHSVADLCQIAFGEVGITDWEQHVTIDPSLSRHDWEPCGDSSKATKALGWRHQFSFGALVREMVHAQTRDQHVDTSRDRSWVPRTEVWSDYHGRALQGI